MRVLDLMGRLVTVLVLGNSLKNFQEVDYTFDPINYHARLFNKRLYANS